MESKQISLAGQRLAGLMIRVAVVVAVQFRVARLKLRPLDLEDNKLEARSLPAP